MAAAQQTFEFLQESQDFQLPSAPQPVASPAAADLAPTSDLASTSDLAPTSDSARASDSARPLDRHTILSQLRTKVGCLSTAPQAHRHRTFSTGSAELNRLLPTGGLRVDGITEWVSAGDASGAASLSLIGVAHHLGSRGRGPLVVVSDHEHFYPPAAVALGIAPERIVWVRPSCPADAIWSIDQALRCGGVGAVWAPLGAGLDDRDARRFQLAAEAGGTPGVFLRPAATRHRPSFAEIRFYVAPMTPSPRETRQKGRREKSGEGGRVLQVTLDRCRGGAMGESVWLRISDQGNLETVPLEALRDTWGWNEREQNEKTAVHLASKLAHPKTSLRSVKRA